MSISEYS